MTVAPTNEALREQYAADKSHHLANGRFVNPWPSFTIPPFTSFLKYMAKDFMNSPATESLKQGRQPTVVPLDRAAIDSPSALQVTWLGHASLLLQIEGVTVLMDPVFSERCSPSQWFGPKRYTKAACTVAELPPIDILILSHNHYDHLDWNTLKQVRARFPDIKVFAPLGNQPILKSLGFSDITIADWWDEFTVELARGARIRLACTPAQHMTARGILDRMATLWSSWVVMGATSRFFFSGDTAYSAVYQNEAQAECPAFKQIGSVYGPIDLAAIAIGAYGPESLFGGMHTNPEQAVRIHEEVGSRKSIGIHWGTFILTSEAIDEPPKRLALEAKARGHADDAFTVLKIGQTTQSS
ncbi:Protein-lysine N-methyltransferase efm4 [Coemansia sp. RSA 2706]|nr:Protein-lysine N-methyltransferase efm4 [Coemansia sp. RSA 2711]KAJ2307673.1 Protein-lysine N-methyltransferase efm4 [Coemansia sp. RSA 2706]KAJ2312934.1 Protein-lysine N-methyltransferase efm4 [Coemansia sp. RSA 2705]KAJ2329035.1 Protein-lysine N-methyltransferase efm4 [Coemansia sp. RSA 2702]KAJ2368302.1 Protein-lysine N-methyltransferase efm4 [Coemansia sp. RSA 2610]KAJ2390923.1 Protein-lysine N-methyltransferase efm4 [Coemansia sp. RSA 2611]KAJ2738572.1 Protein-lysine N-methyltransfera